MTKLTSPICEHFYSLPHFKQILLLLMEALFLLTASAILIDRCTARSFHGGYTFDSYSSNYSTPNIASIVVPIAVFVFLAVMLCVLCRLKRAHRRRLGISPVSTRIPLAQQENQSAPPPYGQPPPYEQPPPYSASMEPTKVMLST